MSAEERTSNDDALTPTEHNPGNPHRPTAEHLHTGEHGFVNARDSTLSHAPLQAMFDRAPVGQAFIGPDGTIVAANAAFLDIAAQPQERIVGTHVLDVIPRAPDHPSGNALERLFEDADSVRYTGELQTGEGKSVPVRVFLRIIRSACQRPQMYTVALVDRTAEANTQAFLEDAHRQGIAAAQRMKFMHQVAASANEAMALEEFATEVITETCGHFKWSAGALVRIRNSRMQLLNTVGDVDWTPIAAAATAQSIRAAQFTIDGRNGQQTVTFTPLTTSSPDTVALLFVHDHAPDERQQEVLARIAGECSHVAQREITASLIQENERQFRAVFDASPFPMGIIFGEQLTYYAVNEAACELLGRTNSDLMGTPVRDVIHPADYPTVRSAASTIMHTSPEGRVALEARLLHASGRAIVTKNYLTLITAPDGTPLLLSQMEDVTEQRQAAAELQRQAETDNVTGLANRTRLVRYLSEIGSTSSGIVVLFADLDGFRLINDARGHLVGDQVLCEVAERLRRIGGHRHFVARFGGDEFVLIAHTDQQDNSRGGPAANLLAVGNELADRIDQALALPVATASGDIDIGCSIGICVSTDADTDPLDLLQRADTALTQAKSGAVERRVVYDASLHQRAAEYRHTEALLRTALAEGRFVVHYQPIVDIADGSIASLEALVRLRDHDGNLIPPGDFISVAERSGLIFAMGAWVMRTSCRLIATLRKQFDPALTVSVNVAAQQAARADLASTVVAALSEAQIPAAALALEVTESTLLEADETTLQQLTALRQMGVRIGLDDFGTGYSSLTYLRRLPVSHIKVDRSFIAEMTTNPGNAAIVRAVTGLAQDLGLRWVAEGIETRDQWQALKAFGPGLAQGFLFAKPVPAEEVVGLVRAGRLPRR